MAAVYGAVYAALHFGWVYRGALTHQFTKSPIRQLGEI
jgi:hypothetical protein